MVNSLRFLFSVFCFLVITGGSFVFADPSVEAAVNQHISFRKFDRECCSGNLDYVRSNFDDNYKKFITPRNSPIHDAVISGNLELCKFLLDKWPHMLDYYDDGDITPYMAAKFIAYSGGKRDILNLFVERGANTNLKTKNGNKIEDRIYEIHFLKDIDILNRLTAVQDALLDYYLFENNLAGNVKISEKDCEAFLDKKIKENSHLSWSFRGEPKVVGSPYNIGQWAFADLGLLAGLVFDEAVPFCRDTIDCGNTLQCLRAGIISESLDFSYGEEGCVTNNVNPSDFTSASADLQLLKGLVSSGNFILNPLFAGSQVFLSNNNIDGANRILVEISIIKKNESDKITIESVGFWDNILGVKVKKIE